MNKGMWYAAGAYATWGLFPIYFKHLQHVSVLQVVSPRLSSDALLVSSGVLTIIPLLMFASATRRIPLSVLGVLQYIAPTLQFLLGVLVDGEPFTQVQRVGFAIV